MQHAIQAIESHLETLTPKANGPEGSLVEAAKYALLSGGKRLRPRLCLAICQQLGGKLEHALQPACALEMVHAYSLVHDDLPCIDDSDLRRGKASLHKAFSEAQAVLAGDLLLTLAFETLAESPGLEADKRLRLSLLLARRAGLQGMIGGQAMDIAFEGHSIPLDHLQQMHLKKTGALIAAACEFGGIIAGAEGATLEDLRLLGEEAGTAFQILDDLLDARGTSAELGKPAGADQSRKKANYVSMMGIGGARIALKTLKLRCEQRLQTLPGNSANLKSLLQELLDRTR